MRVPKEEVFKERRRLPGSEPRIRPEASGAARCGEGFVPEARRAVNCARPEPARFDRRFFVLVAAGE